MMTPYESLTGHLQQRGKVSRHHCVQRDLPGAIVQRDLPGAIVVTGTLSF